jgi:hypothetical protein
MKSIKYTRPILASVLAGATLIGCSASNVDSTAAPLSTKQAKLLDSELKGKTPGKPVNCVSNFSSNNFIRISDSILLYKGVGRTVYQNNLRSNCPGLARDNDVLVIETFGSNYCSGDLIRLVDRFSGIQGPVCSLGEFTPYRKQPNP